MLPICALLLLGAIMFAMMLTRYAIRTNSAQGPLIPGAMSSLEIILLAAATVAGTLWVCWVILKQALTRFTPEGITQPALMGKIHIRWSDIEWVSPGVTIGSATAKIPVSPHAFRDPEIVVQAIMERMPEQTPMVKQPSLGSWLIGLLKR